MKTVAALMVVVMVVVVVMHALKKKTVVVAVVVSICFVVSLCDGSRDGNLGLFILLQNRFLAKKVDYGDGSLSNRHTEFFQRNR
jgi:hypothetical protein